MTTDYQQLIADMKALRPKRNKRIVDAYGFTVSEWSVKEPADIREAINTDRKAIGKSPVSKQQVFDASLNCNEERRILNYQALAEGATVASLLSSVET